MVLLWEKDQKWLTCLKMNDTITATEILKESSEKERDRLINGKFQYEEIPMQKSPKTDFEVSHPWNIAAVHASNEMITILYK